MQQKWLDLPVPWVLLPPPWVLLPPPWAAGTLRYIAHARGLNERTRADRARPNPHHRSRATALRAAFRCGRLAARDARRGRARRDRSCPRLQLPRLRSAGGALEPEVARRASA